MKILALIPRFIPGFSRNARWFTISRSDAMRHPDYFLTAIAVLEKAGHEVLFIDASIENLNKFQIIEKSKNFNPEMAIIFASTPSIYNDIEYARSFHNLGKKTVLIGQHVTAEPENTLKIANGSVIIVRGEYDYTLLDIANNKPLSEIKGISYIENREIKHNEDRELLDVNTLPFPAWHHINPYNYKDFGKRHPFITLLSGRGCNGNCNFCVNTNLMYKRKLRMRNAKSVVDEMEDDYQKFQKLKEIMIETPTFTASPQHVKDICNEILKRKLNITWSCNVRMDCPLSLLPLMKKAGCRMLMEGPETASQELLNKIGKPITVEQTKAFVKEAHKLGFIQHACFMIGGIGETEQTARQTIDFAKSLPFNSIQITGVVAYPGTPIYNLAKIKGWLIPKDWTEYISSKGEQITTLSYPNLSKEKIDELIDTGLKEFYFRPKKIFELIFSIRNIGDIKRLYYGGKSYFKYLNQK